MSGECKGFNGNDLINNVQGGIELGCAADCIVTGNLLDGLQPGPGISAGPGGGTRHADTLDGALPGGNRWEKGDNSQADGGTAARRGERGVHGHRSSSWVCVDARRPPTPSIEARLLFTTGPGRASQIGAAMPD